MNTTNYDSEFCGNLPIQLINLIQPYGVLVVLDKQQNTIIQVSENAEQVFGTPFPELIGKNVNEFLSSPTRPEDNREATDKIPVVLTIAECSYLTLVHNHEHYRLLEIDLRPYEESKQLPFVSVYQDIKYAMGHIQSGKTIQEVAESCAKELKRVSGFDKVMIYRFDSQWNGTVIAEESEQGMEPYRGITFPASDVPQQARMLYHKNTFRLIPTREYDPVRLYPVINPVTNSFIDLSDCNLRAVVAVHLEYLKNMGVMASMSTRILCGEQLWGLIACHHRTPKELSFEMRSVFEMMSNIVSARITSLQNNELHLFNLKIKEQYKNMVEDAYRQGSDNLHQALLDGDPDLLSLFNAEGAAITRVGKIYSKGIVPDKEQLRELLLWLHAKQLRQVYFTDGLPFEYDQAKEFKDISSGILVIPINHDEDEYVILFRQEVIRTINWGGNPEERIQFEPGTRNYHPRNSFKEWRQQVVGTSNSWRHEEVVAAENLRSFIYEFSN